MGFEMFEGHNSSAYLLERQDRLIASEIARYYQIARRIIIGKGAFLDAETEALTDHKAVTFREMQTIREHYVSKKLQCA